MTGFYFLGIWPTTPGVKSRYAEAKSGSGCSKETPKPAEKSMYAFAKEVPEDIRKIMKIKPREKREAENNVVFLLQNLRDIEKSYILLAEGMEKPRVSDLKVDGFLPIDQLSEVLRLFTESNRPWIVDLSRGDRRYMFLYALALADLSKMLGNPVYLAYSGKTKDGVWMVEIDKITELLREFKGIYELERGGIVEGLDPGIANAIRLGIFVVKEEGKHRMITSILRERVRDRTDALAQIIKSTLKEEEGVFKELEKWALLQERLGFVGNKIMLEWDMRVLRYIMDEFKEITEEEWTKGIGKLSMVYSRILELSRSKKAKKESSKNERIENLKEEISKHIKKISSALKGRNWREIAGRVDKVVERIKEEREEMGRRRKIRNAAAHIFPHDPPTLKELAEFSKVSSSLSEL